MDVDDHSGDAVFCQHFCRFQSAVYTQSCRDDRNVRTFAQGNALADLELIVRICIDHRNSKTSETQIYRSYILISSFNGRSCLNIVGRVDHYHTRNRTHQRDILITLVCRAVLAY